jgi:SAM-dependent methyltransferase
MSTPDFVREQLPAPPARVLEIGCGRGHLALQLAAAGYEVVAVDPEAPPGPIFRSSRIEDFTDPEPFEAAVAVLSLHHVDDLDLAVGRAHDLLAPGALIVIREFAAERLEGRTAEWYFHLRSALAAVRGDRAPGSSFELWLDAWRKEHASLHGSDLVLRALRERFEERLLDWTPYLHEYELDQTLEPLERKLVEDGAIAATGYRYCGVRR